MFAPQPGTDAPMVGIRKPKKVAPRPGTPEMRPLPQPGPKMGAPEMRPLPQPGPTAPPPPTFGDPQFPQAPQPPVFGDPIGPSAPSGLGDTALGGQISPMRPSMSALKGPAGSITGGGSVPSLRVIRGY